MNALKKAFNNVIKMNNVIINECLEASRIESPSLKQNQGKSLVKPANK